LTKPSSDWHLQATQSAEARIKAPEADIGFTRQQRSKRNQTYVLGTGEPAMTVQIASCPKCHGTNIVPDINADGTFGTMHCMTCRNEFALKSEGVLNRIGNTLTRAWSTIYEKLKTVFNPASRRDGKAQSGKAHFRNLEDRS